MILCNNCGANLEAEKLFCGECGARNPAFPEPPAPPTPVPAPPKPPGGGKFLLVLLGLFTCFIVGALFATVVFLGSRAADPRANANYSYSNANTGYGSNSYGNANVSASNTSNTYASNVNSSSNANTYANMNANTSYSNMNANSNRRPSMSPFESAEDKLLNNRYLSNSDVSGFSARQLRLLRNTVFAKYGRVFLKDADLQTYFNAKSWYVPNDNYTSGTDYVELTAADEANLDVIKAAEAVYANQ